MSEETVRIEINKTLNAQELELLIHELAEKRSGMEPAVPRTRADAFQAPGAVALLEDEPSAIAVRLKDGRVRLWMRNRGIGWQAFNMDIRNARALRDWLNTNIDGDSDLLSDQIGHTAH